jgi:hypothetical protein
VLGFLNDQVQKMSLGMISTGDPQLVGASLTGAAVSEYFTKQLVDGATIGLLGINDPFIPQEAKVNGRADFVSGMADVLAIADTGLSIAKWLKSGRGLALSGAAAGTGVVDDLTAAAPSSGGRTFETVMSHRGGNRQVLVDGQRWHLPQGTSESAIPMTDALGDQLQSAAAHWSGQWSPSRLTRPESLAIEEANTTGRPWLARLLERQARGRWVEAQIRNEFSGLQWSRTGADILGSTGIRYEILSGTEFNLALHGRRMPHQMFRMITF